MRYRIKSFTRLLGASITVLLLLNSCTNEEQEKTSPPVQAIDVSIKTLLVESLPLHRVELSTEALTVWRQHSDKRPTLVLLTNNPMLVPVPEQLREEVSRLIAQAPQDEIVNRSGLRHPDPLLLTSMTVDAALRAGWFSQVHWIVPLRGTEQGLSAEKIRQQLLNSGMADATEIESLQANGDLVQGRLRGVPIVISSLSQLPEISGSAIVHIDQSWFQRLFKNEISTPIIPLIFETFRTLRTLGLPTLEVTFSNGNLEGRIALAVRFTGDAIAYFIEHPDSLLSTDVMKQSIPDNLKIQSEILYLENFMKKQRIFDLAKRMELNNPNSAWVKYSLYRAAAERQEGDEAMNYLVEAVRLNEIYALEYLNLVSVAYKKGRPDESLRMLKLAEDTFPDNFDIALQMAQVSAKVGDRKSALHFVDKLQKMPWSTVYYAQMPEYLQGFADYLEKDNTIKASEDALELNSPGSLRQHPKLNNQNK